MKIENPASVSWELFAVLDEEADVRDATIGNVLDVAAIVVARYIEHMAAELEVRGYRDAGRAERAAWRIFRERTRPLVEHKGGPVH